jgi:hypothetical protein
MIVRSFAVLVTSLLAACAQQPGASPSSSAQTPVPADAPIDRWESGVKKNGETIVYANAGIATTARDAALLLGCTSDDESIVLVIDPNETLRIDPSIRPVTIILDGATTFTQDWSSTESAYVTAEPDPGFAVLLAELMRHKEVEFVLGEPGRVIDRRRFRLDGAAKAIDDVVSNCAKKA